MQSNVGLEKIKKVQCCTLSDFIQRKDITVVNCKIMIER